MSKMAESEYIFTETQFTSESHGVTRCWNSRKIVRCSQYMVKEGGQTNGEDP
jgi:hypothetical protein